MKPGPTTRTGSTTRKPADSLLQLALHQRHHAVARLCDHLVVGDHGDGLAVLVQAAEEVEDRAGGVGVEVARRLVSEQDARAVDQSSGDGDALSFPAGELGWALDDVHASSEQTDQILDAATDAYVQSSYGAANSLTGGLFYEDYGFLGWSDEVRQWLEDEGYGSESCPDAFSTGQIGGRAFVLVMTAPYTARYGFAAARISFNASRYAAKFAYRFAMKRLRGGKNTLEELILIHGTRIWLTAEITRGCAESVIEEWTDAPTFLLPITSPPHALGRTIGEILGIVVSPDDVEEMQDWWSEDE
jgi:hypothetical protein